MAVEWHGIYSQPAVESGMLVDYSATVRGTSTHFGTVSVDPTAHVLTFRIEAASFPNEDATVQKRAYELTGDVLSYKLHPRPNGDVPISTCRRVR